MRGLNFRDPDPGEHLPEINSFKELKCFYMSEMNQKQAGWSLCFSAEAVSPDYSPLEIETLKEVCRQAVERVGPENMVDNPSRYYAYLVHLQTRPRSVAVFIHMLWHTGRKDRKRG